LSTEEFACHNPSCPDYNRSGGENITLASTIKTKRKDYTKRWHCITCNQYFSEYQGGFRYRLRADKDELIKLISCYQHGDTITSISKTLGRDSRTVSNWLDHLMMENDEAIKFLTAECQLSPYEVRQLRERYLIKRRSRR
jgi:transposase-like protein